MAGSWSATSGTRAAYVNGTISSGLSRRKIDSDEAVEVMCPYHWSFPLRSRRPFSRNRSSKLSVMVSLPAPFHEYRCVCRCLIQLSQNIVTDRRQHQVKAVAPAWYRKCVSHRSTSGPSSPNVFTTATEVHLPDPVQRFSLLL